MACNAGSSTLVVSTYPELQRDEQLDMLYALIPIITKDVGIAGIGRMSLEAYTLAHDVLLVSEQLREPIAVEQIYRGLGELGE